MPCKLVAQTKALLYPRGDPWAEKCFQPAQLTSWWKCSWLVELIYWRSIILGEAPPGIYKLPIVMKMPRSLPIFIRYRQCCWNPHSDRPKRVSWPELSLQIRPIFMQLPKSQKIYTIFLYKLKVSLLEEWHIKKAFVKIDHPARFTDW